jgi:hypothetical protein
MHCPIEDQLKHDVHEDPHGEQSAESCCSTSQQFSSTSSMEEQTEQVGRILRPGILQAPANPQEDGNHRLDDEAEASIEKLNPMTRASSVKVAATIRSRSWCACSSRLSCLLRRKSPIRAESHIMKKERTKTMSGCLIKLSLC